MKKFLTAFAFAAAAMASSVASADTMQNTYGNTIVVTYANGSETRFYFNEDGTFTGLAPGGSTMAGRYTVEGENLCLIQPNGAQQCTAVATDKNVGDTWQQTGSDGSTITVTLQAGR